jgi:hypothetical protein
MTVEVKISDMRAAGKPGYVAKIVEREKVFLSAKDRSGYSTSRETLVFELSEDGIYEVCDANFGSSKRNIYFIRLEDGEEVDRSDILNELIVKSESLSLPDLVGSVKQVNWAEGIRSKAIASILQKIKPEHEPKVVELLPQLPLSAKAWIDHRDNAVDWAMSQLKQLAS